MTAGQRALQQYLRDMDVYRHGGLYADRPPATSDANLRAGDVVLRLPASTASIGIASVMFSGFSHCGMVLRASNGLEVADCYPETSESPGGPRIVPWKEWSSVDEGAGMVHWAALRWPGLDEQACRDAACRAMSCSRFTLLPGGSGEAKSPTYNCATLLTAILESLGVDLSGIDRLSGIANSVFRRFLGLVEAGFYDIVDCTSSKQFLHLAREHGLIEQLPGQSQLLSPSFAEMLPGFSVVAYGRPTGAHQASIGPWLDFYRRTVAGLRAAVRVHGLSRDEVPPAMLRRAGRPFRNAAAGLAGAARLSGPDLARAILLQLADSPGPYLVLPMAAWYAGNGRSDLMRRLFQATAACAPPLLDMAALLGWKPLLPFRRTQQPLEQA